MQKKRIQICLQSTKMYITMLSLYKTELGQPSKQVNKLEKHFAVKRK